MGLRCVRTGHFLNPFHLSFSSTLSPSFFSFSFSLISCSSSPIFFLLLVTAPLTALHIPPLPPTSSISPLGACPLLRPSDGCKIRSPEIQNRLAAGPTYCMKKRGVEGREKVRKNVGWGVFSHCDRPQAMGMYTNAFPACMCSCAHSHTLPQIPAWSWGKDIDGQLRAGVTTTFYFTLSNQ